MLQRIRLSISILVSLGLPLTTSATEDPNDEGVQLAEFSQNLAEIDAALARLQSPAKSPKPATPEHPARTITVDCNAKKPDSIAGGLAKAQDGDTIQIRGNCRESVLVQKDVILDGGGSASIMAASPDDTTIVVFGASVQVVGLLLEGPATSQITASNGGGVGVESCVIRNGSTAGVIASFGSRATVIRSELSNNRNGVVAIDSSAARVGIQFRSDAGAGPNQFIGNTNGVVATDGSTVVVVGNSIVGSSVGVAVVDGSRGLVASNMIANNGLGIVVNLGASLELANPADPSPIFATPNLGLNLQAAILCNGGSISGQIGGFLPAIQTPIPPGALSGVQRPPHAFTFCQDATVP